MSGIIRKEDMHESFWKEGVSNPNLLINGDFRINQRGNSSYTTSNNYIYTFDRWMLSEGIISKTDFGVKIKVESYDNEINFQQYVENIKAIKGKVLTLSWDSIIDNDADITYLIASFTSDGVETYCSGTEKYKSSDGVQHHSITFTIQNNIDSSCENLIVRLLRNSNCSINISIRNVKLEIGDTPTAFYPRSYAEELALCQRYYIKYPVPQSLIITDTAQIGIDMHLPVSLRVHPTILLDNDCYFHTTSSQTPIKIHSAGDSLGCQPIEGNLSDLLLWFCNSRDEYAAITDGLIGAINTSNTNGNKLSGACILEIDAEIY